VRSSNKSFTFDLTPTRLADPLRQRVSVARAMAKRGAPTLGAKRV